MLGDGGWEERCLKLYPNPEMPEKVPRATSSFEVGRFPQPPLACADQAWSEAGRHAIPTYSSSRQPGLVHRPQLSSPSHIYKKEGVWALGLSIPFPEKKGLQSVDLSPAGMASEAVAALQTQQRRFFSFQLWKRSVLIYSFLSLERTMRRRSCFFP